MNTPQENSTNIPDNTATVSIRCMHKLVWAEAVIYCKRKDMRMSEYMARLIIEDLGLDASKYQ